MDQTYIPLSLLSLSLPPHVQSTFSLPHSQKSRPFPALFVICLWSSLSVCPLQYHFFSLCLSCLFLLLTVCIDHFHFNLILPFFFCPSTLNTYSSACLFLSLLQHISSPLPHPLFPPAFTLVFCLFFFDLLSFSYKLPLSATFLSLSLFSLLLLLFPND